MRTMTEFEKATQEVKQMAVVEFKKELIKQIRAVYEHEYPTASGDFDEFYHDVLNLIRNA